MLGTDYHGMHVFFGVSAFNISVLGGSRAVGVKFISFIMFNLVESYILDWHGDTDHHGRYQCSVSVFNIWVWGGSGVAVVSVPDVWCSLSLKAVRALNIMIYKYLMWLLSIYEFETGLGVGW